MTQTQAPPVLVTGATGRVGRLVVDLLVEAGVPVRTLTHRSDAVERCPRLSKSSLAISPSPSRSTQRWTV
jgi:nucleoside-diphosphate-sugar epimerase